MKNKKKAVFTVITGNKDDLKDIFKNKNWDYLCFTDDISKKHSVWKMKTLPKISDDIRRNSRLPKLLAHKYLNDYDYSVYLDGNIELIADPDNLIKELKDNAIAFFRNSWRDCIYEEANAVINQKRESKKIILNQIKYYESKKYPRKNGLINGQVIVRKHTNEIAVLNQMWWDVYSKYSKRDQLAFNFCAWRMKIKYSIIPGLSYYENDYVKVHTHLYPTSLNWNFFKTILRNGFLRKKNLISLLLYFKNEKLST